MNDLRAVLQKAVENPPADPFDIDELVGQGRRRVRRNRLTVAGVAAAVAVLAAASISVAPRLVDHATQPVTHFKTLLDEGLIPQDAAGVWVDSLPSGSVAQAAWLTGDVLHAGAKNVRVTGDGVSASSVITLRSATSNGWFVSVGDRLGVIHPDGTFVEFQAYPTDTLLLSPNGSQALVAACCDGYGGDVIDTATGRVVMHEPEDVGAFAWTNDGIYGYAATKRNQLVLWKPGVGVSAPSFDESHCDKNGLDPGTTLASLAAGLSGCTIRGLVSVSPDGKTALVGRDMVNVATGQRTDFVGHLAFAPLYRFSYSALWEDNDHVLLELNTPAIAGGATPSTGQSDTSTYAIVRCDVPSGSCERASDPFTGPAGLVPLH